MRLAITIVYIIHVSSSFYYKVNIIRITYRYYSTGVAGPAPRQQGLVDRRGRRPGVPAAGGLAGPLRMLVRLLLTSLRYLEQKHNLRSDFKVV